MRLPMTLLAGFTLIASAGIAQPAKHGLPKVLEPGAKAPQVVLASADRVHAADATIQQAPTEPKRPMPRITHCRCGDPRPGDTTPEE